MFQIHILIQSERKLLQSLQNPTERFPIPTIRRAEITADYKAHHEQIFFILIIGAKNRNSILENSKNMQIRCAPGSVVFQRTAKRVNIPGESLIKVNRLVDELSSKIN